jgi:hypothetical protein
MEDRSPALARRLEWFDRGAVAVARVATTPPAWACYVCPLCLIGLPREAVEAKLLTDEHVPPGRLRGRAIVLTCKPCNNRSGGWFDRHMLMGERVRTFGTPLTTGPLKVTTYHDGVPNRGEAHFDGDAWRIFGIPQQNHPDHTKAAIAAMSTLTDGSTIQMRLHAWHDRRRDGLGWMRAAYLAAFAALGYSYVTQAVFDPLREALADPAGSPFQPRVWGDAALRGRPLDAQLGIIDGDPRLDQCIVAIFGSRIVYLPPFGGPLDFFDTLPSHVVGRAGSINYRYLAPTVFPREPMHICDS